MNPAISFDVTTGGTRITNINTAVRITCYSNGAPSGYYTYRFVGSDSVPVAADGTFNRTWDVAVSSDVSIRYSFYGTVTPTGMATGGGTVRPLVSGCYTGYFTFTAALPGVTVRPSGRLGEATADQYADVWALRTNGQVDFFRGTPSALVASQSVATGLQNISAMTPIPDQNGDGQSDMLVRHASDASLWFYWVGLNGKLARGRQVGRYWNGMDQIFAVGALGGGSTQFVLARRASDGSLWRYNLTRNGLTSGVQIGRYWKGMRIMVGAGDMSGDGRADVVAIRSDGTLWRYLGTPASTLGAATQVGRGWNSFPRAFVPGDMTGDGRLDLMGLRADGTAWLYPLSGSSWGSGRMVASGLPDYKVVA
ncbi:FG-GAP repeat [Mycobacteroides abscessus subsp. abscessus]|nr:FG-GAP repeat [Mycobacteroides abscessus subsp. abscessus]